MLANDQQRLQQYSGSVHRMSRPGAHSVAVPSYGEESPHPHCEYDWHRQFNLHGNTNGSNSAAAIALNRRRISAATARLLSMLMD
jgi:hypothetical protein